MNHSKIAKPKWMNPDRSPWMKIVQMALLLTTLVSAYPSEVFAGYGDLDPAFGSGGMVGIDIGGGDGEAHGMALQKDGRIVLVGSGRPSPNRLVDFAIIRLMPDGSPDLSFGVDGKVTTSFTDYFGSHAKAVAIQADQKIVVVGTARNLNYAHDTFAMARYDTNGRLDKTFGINGKVLTPIYPHSGAGVNDVANAVTIAPDGKIIVAGVTGTFLSDFAVARYHPDGSLDKSFGDRGTIVTDIGGQDSANAVAVQPDGRILLAGNGWSSGSHEDFTLVRYNGNGSLDNSFGNGGIVTTDFAGGSDRAQGIALVPDGRIILAGVGQVSGGCFPNPCERYGVAMAQYNADGSLDMSFGASGGALYDFVASSGIYALKRRADGKLVMAGHHGNQDFLVAVFKPDGNFDESFGGTGAVVVGFGPGANRANALALDAAGRIVVAGRAAPDSFLSQFGVVRIQAPPL